MTVRATANLGTIRVPFYTNSKDLGLAPYVGPSSLKDSNNNTFASSEYYTLSDLPDAEYSVTDVTAQTPTTIVFKDTLPDGTYTLTYRDLYGYYNYANFTVTGGGSSVTTYNGTCGDNLTWTLDDDTGVLTISGMGAMTDFTSSVIPWASYSSSIKSIVVGGNVLTIGPSAFSGCTSLTSVTIPDSVRFIEDCAFQDCTSLTSVTIGNSVTSIESDAFFNCTSLSTVINKSPSITVTKGSTDNGCVGYYATTVINVYGTEATDYTTKTIVKITDNSTPIQVDSAIRDGIGRKIHSTYLVKSDLENIYPIGSVYMSARTDTTPNYTLVESGAQAIGTSYYIDSITAVVNSTGTTYTLSDGTEVNGGSAILPSVGKWETVSLGITGVTAYKRTS